MIGLQAALREGVYRLRILNRIDAIIDGLESGDPLFTPDYITSTAPLTLPNKTSMNGFRLRDGSTPTAVRPAAKR